MRRLRVWLRARRISRIRAERLAREWLEDRAAWERHMDEVEAEWWGREGRRIFGARPT
jgi:hypothetical protein